MEKLIKTLYNLQLIVESKFFDFQRSMELLDFEDVPYFEVQNGQIIANAGDVNAPALDIITHDEFIGRVIQINLFRIQREITKMYFEIGSSVEFKKYCNRLVKISNILLKSLDNQPVSNDLINKILTTGLMNMNGFLDQILEDNQDNLISHKNNSYKIRWNIGPGALGHFLKHLCRAETTDGKQVFENLNKSDVLRLVEDHFVDSEGNPFNIGSVEQYYYGDMDSEPKRGKLKFKF